MLGIGVRADPTHNYVKHFSFHTSRKEPKTFLPIFAHTMHRSRFLLITGWFHVFFGVFFMLFSDLAIDLFMVVEGTSALVIVWGLSGICFAFGIMNLIARHSSPSPALTSVLVGTLFYLLFITACDAHWIFVGVLTPLAWISITLRLVFALGYVYYLGGARKRA